MARGGQKKLGKRYQTDLFKAEAAGGGGKDALAPWGHPGGALSTDGLGMGLELRTTCPEAGQGGQGVSCAWGQKPMDWCMASHKVLLGNFQRVLGGWRWPLRCPHSVAKAVTLLSTPASCSSYRCYCEDPRGSVLKARCELQIIKRGHGHAVGKREAGSLAPLNFPLQAQATGGRCSHSRASGPSPHPAGQQGPLPSSPHLLQASLPSCGSFPGSLVPPHSAIAPGRGENKSLLCATQRLTSTALLISVTVATVWIQVTNPGHFRV